nr:hypothetical protein [Tanacetum cinerariifolium]
DDDEDKEASDEDEDEEEEHLAPIDSVALPAIDSFLLVEEIEPFKTDESDLTPPPPRSPRTKVLFSQTRLHKARKAVRLQPPMAASTESLV